MGHIEAVCVSREKGELKSPVEGAEFRKDWGIEDDAHAGDWHRQVSLLAGESVDRMRKKMPELSHGMFAENIVTRGINLCALAVGDRLMVEGGVVLEITQIGKECHNGGCPIQVATGECIMPKEGIFSRVLEGGRVAPGMSISSSSGV
ncbi:MOSC domain-containing protein [Chlorobium phaeovibrioides]|uniref:MOSC domain-containing protein n=1 Tax=Chlorobium phaeovibrioides TaxID=1094 RepID=UPI001230975C|nr:MOSC domain-containing protein [Chlorobium phaeovibrioides]QEQ57754.1 MOSC domain-containing protein [Chlorobium phaeovibrioides]